MMKLARGTLAIAMALGMLVAAGPRADAQDDAAQIGVDKVMVNKLGGVTVEGSMSCRGQYDQLLAGGITYWTQDEWGQWTEGTISADADDWVAISTNPDNYVVSQPAGRKTMIQVEHGSSRLQTCFTNIPAGTFDWSPPCDATDGAPCKWVTDRFGYDSDEPLFDYSEDGKFKTGTMNVAVTLRGLWIEVYPDQDLSQAQGASVQAETFNSQVIKAVRY